VKFFIDTANIDELIEIASSGMVDGVTTNPSLIAASGKPYHKVLAEICKLVPGPVSAEVIAMDEKNMFKEAMQLIEIASNIVIKLPVTIDGIICCKRLVEKNIKVNMTLCFSETQALIAAKAGATYISPFIGRLDDIGQNGIALVENICKIYKNYNLDTQVLAASIRSIDHVKEAALCGAHVATLPPKLFKSLISHHLTDKGLEIFLKDWDKANKSS